MPNDRGLEEIGELDEFASSTTMHKAHHMPSCHRESSHRCCLPVFVEESTSRMARELEIANSRLMSLLLSTFHCVPSDRISNAKFRDSRGTLSSLMFVAQNLRSTITACCNISRVNWGGYSLSLRHACRDGDASVMTSFSASLGNVSSGNRLMTCAC